MTDVAKGQLVLHGYHVWEVPAIVDGKQVMQKVTEPTAYPLDWPATLAGKSYPTSAVIEAYGDFMLTHITHAQADTAAFIPMKFNIQDDTGRSVFRDAVYLNAGSSANAGQPFILPQKRLFRRTSAVRVNFAVDA